MSRFDQGWRHHNPKPEAPKPSFSVINTAKCIAAVVVIALAFSALMDMAGLPPDEYGTQSLMVGLVAGCVACTFWPPEGR